MFRFADVLLERTLPDFAAQPRKFQAPGQPRVEHIKGERLPKHQTVLFTLEVGKRCCSENFPRFLRLVTHPRSFPGPDRPRPPLPAQSTWKLPCAGAHSWEEAPLGLRGLGPPFAHSELSFPDLPLEGARHQLCALSEPALLPTGQVQASQAAFGGSLGCSLPSEGTPQDFLGETGTLALLHDGALSSEPWCLFFLIYF